MDTEDIAFLKLVFKAELAGNARGTPRLYQSEDSARGEALVATGYLNKSAVEWQGQTLRGYEFTMAGRHAYLNAIHA